MLVVFTLITIANVVMILYMKSSTPGRFRHPRFGGVTVPPPSSLDATSLHRSVAARWSCHSSPQQLSPVIEIRENQSERGAPRWGGLLKKTSYDIGVSDACQSPLSITAPPVTTVHLLWSCSALLLFFLVHITEENQVCS
uniref:Uncharacterized protein n=1 Tax=Lactuca sativa TaxID=4236 RepID=A0A9R1UIZ0_LACSA|nr:hypothetical protein LSAT_V11C900493220 [Lactuca sativa]